MGTEELQVIRQILKSINISFGGVRGKIVWIESPFSNVQDRKIITLEDMHYRYPPDVDHDYDEGYRFTDGQLDMLINWLKEGIKHEKKSISIGEIDWGIVRKLLKSIFIITAWKTVWIEPFFNNMWAKDVKFEDMQYKIPSGVLNTYDEAYRFTDDQLDMLVCWIKESKAHEYDE